MSKIPPVLKPVNRHMTIIPHVKKNETKAGVLLPDDFKPEEDRYITATVLAVAPDCASSFQKLRGPRSPRSAQEHTRSPKEATNRNPEGDKPTRVLAY